jgi:membrane protein
MPNPTHEGSASKPASAWLKAICTVKAVLATTWTVFMETRAVSRAAALSFSSLLGLGPLVAIVLIVAGLVVGGRDPHAAVNAIGGIVGFVAPQVKVYEHLGAGGATPKEQVQDAAVLSPELVSMIDGFVAGAHRGSIGVIGAVSLVVIVLFLFKSVEDTFNEIWGVRSGRSIIMRVVFYWTILTLGSVLFFGAVTLLGAGAYVNVFEERVPFAAELVHALRWTLPIFSFALVTVVLTLFYRVIPHTRVFWRPAFSGALAVALLLMLNNFLGFFYLRRVILTKSLFGSLGVLPVLMFGLYIFWLYVLIGGTISYAVQNAHIRSSQVAWSRIPDAARRRLTLVALLLVCRRFQKCLPPPTASELGTMMRVPGQILNECLSRLADMGLLTVLRAAPGGASPEIRYQPARPLSRITLNEFNKLDENLGDNPLDGGLESIDPLLVRYDEAVEQMGGQEFFQKSLENLFAETPPAF